MQTVEKISISIDKRTLRKLREAFGKSCWRSFSEFLDKTLFTPFVSEEDDRIQEEINQQKGK